MRYRPLKRLIDLVGSSVGLIVLSPVMLIIAALCRARLGKPVLFRQLRPGKDGRSFTMFKFRTMTEARGADDRQLPDADRLTHFGSFLRASSLDELPELWNILRGDMSFVGPRPLLVEYLPRYSVEQRRRHDVRPGLTGLAQIRGRNATSWPERFAYDLEYVDRMSFWVDFRIVCETVGTVLKRTGVSQDGHATMREFEG